MLPAAFWSPQGAVFVNWLRDGARWCSPGTSGNGCGTSEAAGPGPDAEGDDLGTAEAGTAALCVELEPDAYVPCFEARGLSADMPVVVYDDGASKTAARVWWQLQLYGHPSPRILYGGWAAWRAAGGESELYEPCPLKLSTTYEAEPQIGSRASAQEFKAALRGGPGGGPGGASALAVVVCPEECSDAPGPPATTSVQQGDGSPCPGSGPSLGQGHGGRSLPLSRLLGCTPEGVWPTIAQADEARLAARLSSALGVAVGRGSSVRLLLASPQDAALSACVAAAALAAARHPDWAVCEAW
ncbi:hypothetical protein GPECTOR_43g875 [Gonium pectorale]|uniref:Rhodanese domain-containing protein n=1 Tax=Gonium pectorale TaxID=33097 RepID=A0A150G9B7_GONPE|nr:hypothetical protein GPECTOR_43g875 [Gonium pectorale]|eukprot:KXZ46439.1 hypothetical protein GPECTOR_43g875 [Gonium pectorale]